MIHPEDALKLILNTKLRTIETEQVPLYSCLGKINSTDIKSKIDLPSFNKALMDGYCFKYSNEISKYKIKDTIFAGSYKTTPLTKTECYKIMTGAPVPDNVDMLVRKEYTKVENDYITILKKELTNNICPKGTYLREGDIVLSANSLISAKEIGNLATMGISCIETYKAPSIGIISTGSELQKPSNKTLKLALTYDGNSYMLEALAKAMYGKANNYGIVEDQPDLLNKALIKSLEERDITVITGGVSMGDRDFIPTLLDKLGVNTVLHKIALKPGKPLFFGTFKGKAVFGLPGNPVSAFVTFNLFVKPLFYKMMNYSFEHNVQYLKLNESISRKETDRQEYIPAQASSTSVTPIPFANSGHISALIDTNCFIVVEIGKKELKTSENVKIVKF